MASVCKTCKHWKELMDTEKEGICFIQFPPWLERLFKQIKVSRITEVHDSCEFWNVDRGNNA